MIHEKQQQKISLKKPIFNYNKVFKFTKLQKKFQSI